MKLKILQNFIGNVGGQSVPFGIGQVVDVPDKDAIHFVNGGYAEKVEKKPIIKTKRSTKAKQEK